MSYGQLVVLFCGTFTKPKMSSNALFCLTKTSLGTKMLKIPISLITYYPYLYLTWWFFCFCFVLVFFLQWTIIVTVLIPSIYKVTNTYG